MHSPICFRPRNKQILILNQSFHRLKITKRDYKLILQLIKEETISEIDIHNGLKFYLNDNRLRELIPFRFKKESDYLIFIECE